jgi:hypothetical protein
MTTDPATRYGGFLDIYGKGSVAAGSALTSGRDMALSRSNEYRFKMSMSPSDDVARLLFVWSDGSADIELVNDSTAVDPRFIWAPPAPSWGAVQLNLGGQPVQGIAVINSEVTRPTSITHVYDGNGSLLCSKCREPYPYAEPPTYREFVCRSCKVEM